MTTAAGRSGGFVGRLAPNLTVFTSSAAIMVLQLVAGRLIAQHVGQSLWTWTTVIGATLAGIAIGNYIGGRLADRSSSRRRVAALFLLCALALLSVLPLNWLLGAALAPLALTWPARIILHIFCVFLPAFTMLGTISPVISKRALNIGDATGRTMGDIFAWSIGGSILGTFVTGFYLLDHVPSPGMAYASASVLALVGLLYLAMSLRGEAAAQAAGTAAAPQAAGLWSLWRLRGPIAAVFVASACVMTIELVAARMLARHFGSSLYTWTGIIGVILAGMSLGGWWGGGAADRHSDRKLLAALFGGSAFWAILAVMLGAFLANKPLLWGLPWVTHILVYSAILFAPAAFLLGAVPPVLAHQALSRGLAQGRTVGLIYAWNSIGSIVGTFATGFVLIDLLGMRVTLLLASALLTVLMLVYGARRIGAWAAGAVAAALIIAAVAPFPAAQRIGTTLGLRDYVGPGVHYVDESAYTYIKIYSADPDRPELRSFVLDKLVHSIKDIAYPLDLKYPYEWFYTAVMNRVAPPEDGPIRAMVIGGGGFAYPHYLELTRPESYIEAIEIDPAVTEAAHAAFGFPRDTDVRVVELDGRNRIADLVRWKNAGRDIPPFDFIFGDSINDFSVPFHLTTLEFTQQLDSLLADDGIYMLNLIDVYDSGLFLGAVLNTVSTVFEHVYVFSAEGERDQRGTFVVVSSHQPLPLEGVAEEVNEEYYHRGSMLSAEEITEVREKSGLVLTDAFAPVDNLLAPVVREAQDTFLVRRIARADALLSEGDVGAALAEARKIILEAPHRAEAHELLGVALLQAGKIEEAVEALRQAVEVSPSRASAHSSLAYTLFQLGQVEEAVEHYRIAVELNPRSAEDYVGLGVALFTANHWGQAAAALFEAIKLEPEMLQAYTNLGDVLYVQERYDEARWVLEEARRLAPENPEVQQNLAAVYAQLGQRDKALRLLDEMEAAGLPYDPELRRIIEQQTKEDTP